jgi:hypothetical protein
MYMFNPFYFLCGLFILENGAVENKVQLPISLCLEARRVARHMSTMFTVAVNMAAQPDRLTLYPMLISSVSAKIQAHLLSPFEGRFS